MQTVPGISATKLNIIIRKSNNLVIITLFQKTQLLLCKHSVLLYDMKLKKNRNRALKFKGKFVKFGFITVLGNIPK